MSESATQPEKLIGNWVQIPTLPQIVTKVNALVANPDVGLKEIGSVVAQDPPLASQVLKTANSAFYGARETVVSLEHAASILGGKVLRHITLQASVMSMFTCREGAGDLHPEALWKHSVLTAQMCTTLAFRSRTDLGIEPDEFYVVGLLHDIGHFILMESQGEAYLDIARAARAAALPIQTSERRSMGFTHAEVGAVVADRWGLPPLISDAIHYHHGPRERVARDPHVSMIANINLLVGFVLDGDLERAEKVLDAPSRQLLGLEQEDPSDLVQYAAEIAAHTEI